MVHQVDDPVPIFVRAPSREVVATRPVLPDAGHVGDYLRVARGPRHSLGQVEHAERARDQYAAAVPAGVLDGLLQLGRDVLLFPRQAELVPYRLENPVTKSAATIACPSHLREIPMRRYMG